LLIDILGSEVDDVIKEADPKRLDEREKEVVVGRFGLDADARSGRSLRLRIKRIDSDLSTDELLFVFHRYL
jgi:uncharacterized protein (DUF2249 family)